MKRTIFLFLAGVALGLLTRWWPIQQSVREKPSSTLVQDQTQTTVAFQELMIPTLRSRTYVSQLGELTKINQNQQFTSYLTSYDSDGLTINALLTQPTGKAPQNGWPAIVFVHGYIPPTLYRTQEKYVEYTNFLAQSGFVVLKIDLRGHGNSEGEPTGAYYSSGYVIDTLNAYAALETASFVDPKAIGLWGHSMAGNIVLRSLAVKPTIPAAVIWAGAGYTYQDLLDYGLNDTSYRPPSPTRGPDGQMPQKTQRQQLFEAHGQFDTHSPFWQQVVPTNYLAELGGALQLHHAQDDTVVSIRYSENLDSLLSAAAVPHEFYSYQTGGHNISGSNFALAMQRSATFFNTHLKTTP